MDRPFPLPLFRSLLRPGQLHGQARPIRLDRSRSTCWFAWSPVAAAAPHRTPQREAAAPIHHFQTGLRLRAIRELVAAREELAAVAAQTAPERCFAGLRGRRESKRLEPAMW